MRLQCCWISFNYSSEQRDKSSGSILKSIIISSIMTEFWNNGLSPLLVGLIVCFCGTAKPLQAATLDFSILQPQFSGFSLIHEQSGQTISQTFTAVDPELTSIGFGIVDFGEVNGDSEDTDLEVFLYEGIGSEGTRFISKSRFSDIPNEILSDDPQFVDFDFQGVETQVGQTYTVELKDDSVRWAVATNTLKFTTFDGGEAAIGDPIPGRIDYEGGDLLFDSRLPTSTRADTTFRVASVPEPATILASAIILCSGIALKRRLR